MASVQLLLRAQADIEDAAAWHAAQNAQAVARFARAVDEAQARLAAMPEMYADVGGGRRICPVKGTQYLLIYRYDRVTDVVTVTTVVHASQDPAGW